MGRYHASYVIKKMHRGGELPVVASLDVHDVWTYMYVVDVETGELLKDSRIDGHYRNVRRHLAKLGRARDRICVLVEAGPHGFAPYRCFTKAGYATLVISPTSIPQRPQRTKTDREDAVENLDYHVSGKLRYVLVPNEQDEQMRECLRERQKVTWRIIKEKQKLLSLLKRYGHVFTGTKTNWTRKHYEWLRAVALPIPLRALVDVHLVRISQLEVDERSLWSLVDGYLDSKPEHAYRRKWFCKLRGVGEIVSAVLLLEGGDLSRFVHPRPLMNYTGLIPGKRQSGYRDPSLHITKAGNKYLRTALVSIAKYYQDYRTLYSARSLENLPALLREFLDRCQRRLNYFYRSLRARGKESTKARVAVARELCGFIWEFAVKIIPALQSEGSIA
jgi:transposase